MPDVHKHQTPEMHDCIHHCGETQNLAMHTMHDCLKKGGKHANYKHIGLLLARNKREAVSMLLAELSQFVFGQSRGL